MYAAFNLGNVDGTRVYGLQLIHCVVGMEAPVFSQSVAKLVCN